MEWNKGDILWGEGADAEHPIIFLSDYSMDHFLGAMITHGKNEKYEENILMSKEHFEIVDDSKTRYGIQFKDTHLVNVRLLKKLEWAPFTKDGQLTAEGVSFVETNLKNKDPILWEQHIISRAK